MRKSFYASSTPRAQKDLEENRRFWCVFSELPRFRSRQASNRRTIDPSVDDVFFDNRSRPRPTPSRRCLSRQAKTRIERRTVQRRCPKMSQNVRLFATRFSRRRRNSRPAHAMRVRARHVFPRTGTSHPAHASARLKSGRCDSAINRPHQRISCTDAYASGNRISSASAWIHPTNPATNATS